jgi:hypothetical protein
MDASSLTSDYRPRFSFRLKLTLWMTVLFLAVQLLLVLVLQIYQHRSINRYFDDRILARQQVVAAELAGRLPDLTHDALVAYAEVHRQTMGQLVFRVTVFQENGEVFVSSDDRADPLDARARSSLTSGYKPIVVRNGAIPVFERPAIRRRLDHRER